MDYEVEGLRCRGRAKKIWREVAKKRLLTQQLNKEDGIDRSNWRKLTEDVGQ